MLLALMMEEEGGMQTTGKLKKFQETGSALEPPGGTALPTP